MRKRNVKRAKSCKRVTALVLACALASSTAGVPVWEVKAADTTVVEETSGEDSLETSLDENNVSEGNSVSEEGSSEDGSSVEQASTVATETSEGQESTTAEETSEATTEGYGTELASGNAGMDDNWELTDSVIYTVYDSISNDEEVVGDTLVLRGDGKIVDWVCDELGDYRSTITKIVIEEGVTWIGYGAFNNMTNAKSISIPASVVSIESKAFATGYAMDVTIADGNANYCIYKGVLFDKDKTTLIAYLKEDADYPVPEGVEAIAEYAFEMCNTLENVTISTYRA